MYQMGLSSKRSPYITLDDTSYWSHIRLGHASKRFKCKDITMHHVGHASNGLKCKRVTVHHIVSYSILKIKSIFDMQQNITHASFES